MGLIFLRHTTPDVVKGTCYGMTDLGLAQGFESEFDKALQSLPSISHIICSPLARCRQLAEHIADKSRLSVEVHNGLREMDFGRWEMVPWSEVPRAELGEWADDFMGARPHGGESVQQLKDRVGEVLHEISEDTLIVTHSGVIRAAAAITEHPEGWDIDVNFGCWVRL